MRRSKRDLYESREQGSRRCARQSPLRLDGLNQDISARPSRAQVLESERGTAAVFHWAGRVLRLDLGASGVSPLPGVAPARPAARSHDLDRGQTHARLRPRLVPGRLRLDAWCERCHEHQAGEHRCHKPLHGRPPFGQCPPRPHPCTVPLCRTEKETAPVVAPLVPMTTSDANALMRTAARRLI